LLVPQAVNSQINSREIAGYVDLDAERVVVGIDIDHASKLLDLSTLEAESLPLRLAVDDHRNSPVSISGIPHLVTANTRR